MTQQQKKEREILLELFGKKTLKEIAPRKRNAYELFFPAYSADIQGKKIKPWVQALEKNAISTVKGGPLYLCRKSVLLKYCKDFNIKLPYEEDAYPDIFVIGTLRCIRMANLGRDYVLHAFLGVFDPMSPKDFLHMYSSRISSYIEGRRWA